MKTISPSARPGAPKRDQRLVSLIAGILVLACVVVGGLSLYQAGYFSPGTSNSNQTATAAAECQRIVAQAMQASGSYCDQIGPNSVCYGNFTLQAELVPGAADSFSQRGDIINVQELRRLSATPLDLVTDEWGIAVFRVMANLPYSLPGESITMVVFGNTTIDTPNQSLESFYFTSELGQILCEAVPFDGIMINVPDGTGIRFTVNGTEVTLMGNASLVAEGNGDLDIAVYDGSAVVVAGGVEQYIGAGQGVSIPLGGPNGNEAVGPPSDPYAISQNDIAIACTLTGEHCSNEVIPTMGAETAAAILEPHIPTNTPNATATPRATATRIPTRTATPTPTPTRIRIAWTPTSIPTDTPIPLVRVCHLIGTGAYLELTIPLSDLSGHLGHGDIYPVPPGGCPTPTPTTP